jgi:uncharacterized Tic20 family protein
MENQPLDDMNELGPRDERLWATLSHLGVIAGFIIPFGNIVAPLVIWLVQRDKSSFIEHHAKEALNFQITITMLAIGAFVLMFLIIGIPLLVLIGLGSVVFSIIAAIKANDGEHYEYPFNIRLVK